MTVLGVGGTEDTGTTTVPPTAANNPSWNNYEALVINAEATKSPLSAGIFTDQVLNPVTLLIEKEWSGPGTYVGPTPQVEVDWFEEYPRCQVLSSGQILFSGYAPRWGLVHHETPGVWTTSNGQPAGSTTYSSNWQTVRHDGSSILFPNLGGQEDVVVRFGGSNEHWWSGPLVFTTPTVESLDVTSNPAWQAAPDMPTTFPPGTFDGGRFLMNTVILPTGGVLVVGGVHSNGPYVPGASTYVYKPQIFENGAWQTYDGNPVASPRDYHSTAILLPDGRVFVGGGNWRLYDYEIFSPPYLDRPQFRPQNVTWQTPAPSIHVDLGAYALAYDETRTVRCDPLPLGQTIEKVVFMAPGSVTHHSDMHQRYREVRTSVTGGNTATFTTPATEAELPRGIYMMFLVTNKPSVSHAEWVVFL